MFHVFQQFRGYKSPCSINVPSCSLPAPEPWNRARNTRGTCRKGALNWWNIGTRFFAVPPLKILHTRPHCTPCASREHCSPRGAPGGGGLPKAVPALSSCMTRRNVYGPRETRVGVNPPCHRSHPSMTAGAGAGYGSGVPCGGCQQPRERDTGRSIQGAMCRREGLG